MGITTVTKKGQITIPADVRRALALKEHDKVVVKASGGKAIIEKAVSASDLKGSIKISPAQRGADWETIRQKARRSRTNR